MKIDPEPVKGLKDKISCYSRGKILILNPLDIVYIAAGGSYATVYCRNKVSVTVSKSMSAFEKELPVGQFLKCHRSFVVNVAEIEEIDTFNNKIVLRDKNIIPLSHRRHKEFLSKLTLIINAPSTNNDDPARRDVRITPDKSQIQ